MKAIVILYQGQPLTEAKKREVAKLIHELCNSNQVSVDYIRPEELSKLIVKNSEYIKFEEKDTKAVENAITYIGNLFAKNIAEGNTSFLVSMIHELHTVRNQEFRTALEIIKNNPITPDQYPLLRKYEIGNVEWGSILEIIRRYV